LATFRTALDRVGQGRAGFAAVVGVAGIGKTGLVMQATGSAAPDDLLVLRGNTA
jgi:predicted ATPase